MYICGQISQMTLMKKFYIETYGCQMNVYDSQLVKRILMDHGWDETQDFHQADLILVNTCAVRENAEQRVRGRLGLFKTVKRDRPTVKVGLLGCMGQRLKEQLIEEENVLDFVMGPDTYRRLPVVLDELHNGIKNKIVDVKLDKTEMYDDVLPERDDQTRVTTFVTITRGCDNMCAFCIVPFTRGRERSKDPRLIIQEIEDALKQGYKEVMLLGQNVDKYHYQDVNFARLLDMVASIDPQMRVRFLTSYPQDLKNEVLEVMAGHENIARNIHLPVQSGSNRILELMRRGYTREWYLDRIKAIREIVPDCAIGTDIIAGFCTETEEDHQQTMDLMDKVQFDYAYMFKYSERPNTYAARNLPDDVPEETKIRRLNEIIELQNRHSYQSNQRDVGKIHQVLVEKTSHRSEKQLLGRNSQGKVIIFEADKSLIGQYVDVEVYDFTQATLLGRLKK